jgi:ligand-binding sensor domain-containing protein
MICIALSGSAFAQNDTLYFGHYSIEQGLSHNDVTSIIQDSLGFMWYGTEAGLNKFDGYSFIVYRHDPKNTNSLASDDISCMSVDKSGIIWIGTKMKGINRLDPYTGIFTAFQHIENDTHSLSDDRITSIYVDTLTHHIWIGTATHGLNEYNPLNNTFTNFISEASDPSTICGNNIACITQDRQRKIWIGTSGNGVSVYSPFNGKFSYFTHREGDTSTITGNDIRSIFIDNLNQVWIATGSGLSLINQTTGRIKIFRHHPENPLSLSSDDLTSVYQDKAGKIWIGTRDNGLNVLYPKDEKFFLYSHETGEVNTLSSDKINAISQGRSGMFWAATRDGGLNAFNPKSLKFKLHAFSAPGKGIGGKITSIFEQADLLWLGTSEAGMFSYDPATQQLEKNDDARISNDKVLDISSNGKEKLVISTEHGLFELALNSSSPSSIRSAKVTELAAIPLITGVFNDGFNTLWISSREKVYFHMILKSKSSPGIYNARSILLLLLFSVTGLV